MTRAPDHLVERWLGRVVETDDGCWIWPGATDGRGYGHVAWTAAGVRKDGRLPRVIYEHVVGVIPSGLHLDHLCRRTLCVNPAHLEPVTCRENIRRGVGVGGLRPNSLPAANKAKTHCVRGHRFDSVNTHVDRRTGKRYCRICRRAARAAQTAREKAAA